MIRVLRPNRCTEPPFALGTGALDSWNFDKSKPGGRGARTFGNMRRLCPFFLVAFLACSCDSERLGHGYRLVHRTEDMRGVPGAFEGSARRPPFPGMGWTPYGELR